MKKQYKEYKVIDKDLSEFLLYDEKISYSFDEIEIEVIEDMWDLKVSDLKKIMCEKIEEGNFVDFIEKLCRNRLMNIVPMLVLDKREFFVYDLFYKKKETQSEIGKKLGITRQSVNKTVKKINTKFENASGNITEHYYKQGSM
ncbi:MAG: MarR family transcriptional regulator [Fusobacteriales bacterium]|jgi:DNA-directed RNA polymerase specialized sigma subunit|nr:MarR family transcriptional regulator [Fusobacteriales bacterium]